MSKAYSGIGTINKVARLCDMPHSTLHGLVNSGEIRKYELGCGTVVVKIADVRKWLATKARKPGRPAETK